MTNGSSWSGLLTSICHWSFCHLTENPRVREIGPYKLLVCVAATLWQNRGHGMDDLQLLIKSRHPIVYVETDEEDRVVHALEVACQGLGLALFTWSVTSGVRRLGTDQPIYDTQEPAKALQHIHVSRLPAVYLLQDFHPYLTEPRLVRLFREIAQTATKLCITLVLSAPKLELPVELRKLAARFELKLPDEEELRQVILETFRELNRARNYTNRLEMNELVQLARNLKGLTAAEACRVVSRCVLDDNVLDSADLAHAISMKKERVEQSGTLEYFDVRSDLPSLGGLRSLKAWLRRFAAGFSDKARQMGLRPPRGILLVGIQGCGKSLAAKTIALEWKLPLVRLDPAQLFDKYVGESEKNLRQAFETAEAISPVVLWIDEIEKAFAGASSSESDAGWVGASSVPFSPGCRKRKTRSSSPRPPTTSRPCPRNCSARAGSTKSFSSTCRMRRSAVRFSASTSASAINNPSNLTWKPLRWRAQASAAPRSSRRLLPGCTEFSQRMPKL